MPTIGVAVAIPEPWASELQDYRASLGDETASSIPTHITLIPPTEVADGTLDEVVDHLSRSTAGVPEFTVRLRGTGTFRPVSPVVFVTVAEGISACEQLAQAIRRGPLAVQLSFPYHPHVTIAHHLPEEILDRAFEELAHYECAFVADHFELYVHDAAQGWVPTRDFALRAAGGDQPPPGAVRSHRTA